MFTDTLLCPTKVILWITRLLNHEYIRFVVSYSFTFTTQNYDVTRQTLLLKNRNKTFWKSSVDASHQDILKYNSIASFMARYQEHVCDDTLDHVTSLHPVVLNVLYEIYVTWFSFSTICQSHHDRCNVNQCSRIGTHLSNIVHDDVIKWNHFPRYWPFGRGIHRSSPYSPHRSQ